MTDSRESEKEDLERRVQEHIEQNRAAYEKMGSVDSEPDDQDDDTDHSAKINGRVEVKYCPHCGAHPVIATRGENTDDICIDCRDCGKFIWVRSTAPDDPVQTETEQTGLDDDASQ